MGNRGNETRPHSVHGPPGGGFFERARVGGQPGPRGALCRGRRPRIAILVHAGLGPQTAVSGTNGPTERQSSLRVLPTRHQGVVASWPKRLAEVPNPCNHGLYITYPQFGQQQRQEVADRLGTAPPGDTSLCQTFYQRHRLLSVLAARQPVGRHLELGQHTVGQRPVLLMEFDQFIEDRTPGKKTRMWHEFSTRHNQVGQPAEAAGDLHVGVTGSPWAVTRPGLPQTRTCAINAFGSSSNTFASTATNRRREPVTRYPLALR